MYDSSQTGYIKNGQQTINLAPKGGNYMARSRKPVNPAAENALDRMKFEIAFVPKVGQP